MTLYYFTVTRESESHDNSKDCSLILFVYTVPTHFSKWRVESDNKSLHGIV